MAGDEGVPALVERDDRPGARDHQDEAFAVPHEALEIAGLLVGEPAVDRDQVHPVALEIHPATPNSSGASARACFARASEAASCTSSRSPVTAATDRAASA